MADANDKIKIFVTFHKDYELDINIKKYPEVYIPIFCGSAVNAETDFLRGILHDDTGYNISRLNPFVSELTALYWIYYNYKDLDSLDYIGINHYRRIFDYAEIADFQQYDLICYDNMFNRQPGDLLSQLKNCHSQKALDMMGMIIEYMQVTGSGFWDYAKTHAKSRYFFPKAMFVMKTEFFENLFVNVIEPLKYMPQVFNILYPSEDKRLCAYICERFISLFFQKMMDENKKVKYVKNIMFL